MILGVKNYKFSTIQVKHTNKNLIHSDDGKNLNQCSKVQVQFNPHKRTSITDMWKKTTGFSSQWQIWEGKINSSLHQFVNLNWKKMGNDSRKQSTWEECRRFSWSGLELRVKLNANIKRMARQFNYLYSCR